MEDRLGITLSFECGTLVSVPFHLCFFLFFNSIFLVILVSFVFRRLQCPVGQTFKNADEAKDDMNPRKCVFTQVMPDTEDLPLLAVLVEPIWSTSRFHSKTL